MKHPTHTNVSLIETHQDAEHGGLIVNRVAQRHPAETARLRRLAAQLGDQDFTVTRGVVVSTAKAEKAGAPRRIEVQTFAVEAANGAEAGRLADAAKWAAERKAGHHGG